MNKKRFKNCDNGSISLNRLESVVLSALADYLFSDMILSHLVQYIRASSYSTKEQILLDGDLLKLEVIKKDIESTITIMMRIQTGSLDQKLTELDKEKNILEKECAALEKKLHRKRNKILDERKISKVFFRAKGLFIRKELPNVKSLVHLFVQKIVLKKDGIDIILRQFAFD